MNRRNVVHTKGAAGAMPHLDGVRHSFIDLPGLRMHVAEAGSGEPVVLLHGFPQHWWEWRGVIPGLAERYRVICPDLRGAGWTDAPRDGYTRDQRLADMMALLDRLELDRVHVVSHDMGSITGFAMCLDHPDRVSSHVALGVPPPFMKFSINLLPALRHLWFQQALAVPGLGARLVSTERQRLPRYLFSAVRSGTAATEADVETYLDRLRPPELARAASALYLHMVLPEEQRIMSGLYRRMRIETPTLLVFGADDAAFPPHLVDVVLRGHETYADHLEVAFVENAAHFIVDEQPGRVRELVQDFLART